MPKVNGVLLMKLPFLTKTWGPTSEARKKECAAAMEDIYLAVVSATLKAAQNLHLVNE